MKDLRLRPAAALVMKPSHAIALTLAIASAIGFLHQGGANASPPLMVPGRTVRVLAVGDSITEGLRGYQSWRGALVQMAQHDGYRIGYTGPYPNGPRPDWAWWGRRHAARSGRLTQGIASMFPAVISKYRPQIVLVMAGSNDAAVGTPIPQTLAAMRRIIEAGKQANTWVLVSEVTPRYRRPNDPDPSYIRKLNAALQAEVVTHGCRVFWVPQPHFVDHDTIDGVHPNAGGEVKIALSWLRALTTPSACAV